VLYFKIIVGENFAFLTGVLRLLTLRKM